MFKKDSIWIGIAQGLIIPALFYLFIGFLGRKIELDEHTQSFLFILGMGLNALIMRYDMKHGYDKTMRGILLASFVYAFLFIIYKIKVGL